MSVRREADMFVSRALEKILADKDIKKPAYSQLKKTCQVALGKKLRKFKTNLFIQMKELLEPYLAGSQQ